MVKRLLFSAFLCVMLIISAFGMTVAAVDIFDSTSEAYGLVCPDSASGRHKYEPVETPAGCTTEGKLVRKCSYCGEVISETPIDATGHSAETIPSVAATCTSTGLTEGSKCSVCGEILVAQTVIDKAAHTEVTVPGKDATCTETGLTEGSKCTVCGETVTEQDEIPTLDHTEEVVAGKAATCSETGLTEGSKCSVCGEILVAQTVIDKAAHTEVTVPGKDATCTETGLTEGSKCSECGETLDEQEEIPALGHTTTSGTCGLCGEKQGDSGGSTTPGLDNVPKTGDATPYGLFLLMGLLMFAAVGLGIIKVKIAY